VRDAGALARLVLGQKKVDEKSNEITAIPELIKVLDLAGCIVTIDAMGCQREIVKQISQKQAVITVKLNPKNLYENIENLFKEAIRNRFEGCNASTRFAIPLKSLLMVEKKFVIM